MFQPTSLYPFNCTSYFGLLWIGFGLGVRVFTTCGWGMYGNGIIIAVGEGLNTVYLTLMHSYVSHLTLGCGSDILNRMVGTRTLRCTYKASLAPSQIMLTINKAALRDLQSS